eukprot:6071080-Amphidinium_carterae.1
MYNCKTLRIPEFRMFVACNRFLVGHVLVRVVNCVCFEMTSRPCDWNPSLVPPFLQERLKFKADRRRLDDMLRFNSVLNTLQDYRSFQGKPVGIQSRCTGVHLLKTVSSDPRS